MARHHKLLALGGINGAVELLTQALEDVADDVVAITVVGDLGGPESTPETYRTVFRALGRTEQEMVPRLQQLQLSYHARALAALSSGGSIGEAERASRGAAAVGGIIDTLQRRNPNRP